MGQQQPQRSKVQFRVSADNEDYGVINLEMFDEVVPRTVANFVAIASGQNQQGFSYKGTIFHRIIPQFMLQGGDFERFDGTGGQSIYGPKFDDKNVVFGRVDDQESFNVVKRIEALGSSGGTPS